MSMPDLDRLSAALADRYRIERELGAGGMATVYLAEDLKHHRKVALKVLRPELSDLLGGERFLKEIEVTANLQHPHVLPLFDSGVANGLLFYVMPYVAGESLRQRLAREQQLPIDDAIRIVTQVASALDYAHRRNVVHRDIKPENILLEEGQALVADFGIALALSRRDGKRLTETGLSLGTPHYMSPEQAAAEKAITHRSDIYSLGAVLYEMLTGSPPHVASSAQQIVMKILADEARPVTDVRKAVRPNVAAAVAKALEKLPADRFESAGAFAEALHDPEFAGARSAQPLAARLRSLPAIGMLALGIAAGALVAWGVFGRNEADGVAVYLPVALPVGVELAEEYGSPTLAISPDGRRLVYAATSGGVRRLYLQGLTAPGGAQPIPGTEGGLTPFFSPDGGSVGFASAARLQVVSLSGGDPRKLAPTSRILSGAAWSPDGDIYYPGPGGGLWKVAAAGGTPTAVTTPLKDGFDNAHLYPDLLPGGRKLIYTSAFGRHRLVALDLASGETTTLLENETAFFSGYVRSGHLMFAQPGGLRAVAFDPQTLQVGIPFEVLPDAVVELESHADFSISSSGTIAYIERGNAYERTLVRIERNGDRRVLETNGPQPFALMMSAAPGGNQFAVSLARGGQLDVFIYDLQDLRQLITEHHNDFTPVWSRDGTQIAFTSVRTGTLDLYVAPADRSSMGSVLHASGGAKWVHSWSPGDSLLAFAEAGVTTGMDIWIFSRKDDSARVLIAGPETEIDPAFSPDGRWLAFTRGDATPDIWVTPFPGPGPECKVSNGGGAESRWSRDGAELFYRNGSIAMVADVRARDFCAARSNALFDGLEPQTWTVAPDGTFFVTVAPRAPPRLWVVQNWDKVLREHRGAP